MLPGLVSLHEALALTALRAASAGYEGEREMRQLLVSLPDLLASRPNQQPNMWLDWHEVRNILRDDTNGREDYAIIAARAAPAVSCVGSC